MDTNATRQWDGRNGSQGAYEANLAAQELSQVDRAPVHREAVNVADKQNSCYSAAFLQETRGSGRELRCGW
jgi:hypothetical protein